ncbi:MAG: DUF3108 domain-containing protein [Nitrospinae bacterium]|nr:DUF3108 domain-containing protein [Nitrospinota bacterium]
MSELSRRTSQRHSPPLRQNLAVLLIAHFVALSGIAAPVWAESPSASPANDDLPGLYDSFEPKGDIRRFDGETLHYDISFLWFDKAATAAVSFYKLDGQYQALLVAETKGFVGWFTSYRKHVYKSTFDIVDNGERIRSNKFEREVVIGDDVEKTTHSLDYAERKHGWRAFKNGALTDQGTEDIPPDVYFDDILAAFYNFRNSAYGKLAKGATFKINTIPEKGVKEISIFIKTEKEEETVRVQQIRKKTEELLLRVIIPKEIFKTKTGELLFWSSKNYIPLETTVVDYVLLGDLHARFVKRTASKSAPIGLMTLSESAPRQ